MKGRLKSAIMALVVTNLTATVAVFVGVPQFGAADVLEDLSAGGVAGDENADWIAPLIAMGYWPPKEGPRVKGFEDAAPKLITVKVLGAASDADAREAALAVASSSVWGTTHVPRLAPPIIVPSRAHAS